MLAVWSISALTSLETSEVSIQNCEIKPAKPVKFVYNVRQRKSHQFETENKSASRPLHQQGRIYKMGYPSTLTKL